MNMRILGFVLFFLLVQTISRGQVVATEENKIQNEYHSVDSLERLSLKEERLHSPSRAAIYEALLPGLGHIYNKKAWHIPITYIVLGLNVYLIIDNTEKYQKYRNAYEDFSVYRKFIDQTPQYPLPIPEPTSQRFRKVLDIDYLTLNSGQVDNFQKALKNNKDAFRRYRDLSYISFTAFYLLNIVWATVDAHFFYYDISDDLSLRVEPQMFRVEGDREALGVNLVFKF